MKQVTLFITGLLLAFSVAGQNKKPKNPADEKLVQFSGVVLTADSLYPVSYCSVVDFKARNVTYADYNGFFSFVARKGDTIMFGALGHKKAWYVIPDTLTAERYTILQLMQPDTIVLPEIKIYPWPSREDFANAFQNLDVGSTDIDNMNRNLTLAELKQAQYNFGTDALGSYKNAMAMEYTRVYGAGQIPTVNLLSPSAWSKFIKAWKNGDFKSKDKKD
jgi:hypothetical protein